jgi:FtsH-binding integral membrane protein
MAFEGFSWKGFWLRLLGALVLVYATYNPEGVSFFHWVLQHKAGETGFSPLKAFAGLILLAGWVVFLQATRRSLGAAGALLVMGLFGCTIWAMVYYGVMSPNSSRAIAHLVLLAVSLVLAIGMSWSLVTRKLTGQIDTDNVA